ncbi:hypothetical protein [Streptomyces brasiliscabiei]|uniref:hypothetical protein n=1 Tax=Streptomyces brasiliscabiei TaxID=2736302 RepID=UPI001C119976|nr:hypothetical protein [Streptomyces brasiliscabiei]
MSILGVHGIGNRKYFSRAGNDLALATENIGADWLKWLEWGRARHTPVQPSLAVLPVAYYADCLAQDIPMGTADVENLDPLGRELFVTWVEEVGKERVGAQWADQVSQNGIHKWAVAKPAAALVKHFGQGTCDVLARASDSLSSYFDPQDTGRREKARQRIAEAIRKQRPRAILAHSLGSVVTYEALCAEPELGDGVELLVTLGSPLGVPHVVFERLDPLPRDKGIRPPRVGAWVNIADVGDPVALPPGRLGERFEGLDEDITVSLNVLDPHGVKNYLRCRKLAEVLKNYLH